MTLFPSIRLICPTPASLVLANKLRTNAKARNLHFDLWTRPKSIRDGLNDALDRGQAVVAICALGIVVRLLSERALPDKARHAPILCAREDGRVFIPVIGGHRGGNAMAKTLAELTGGNALITTASDQTFDLILDEPPAGWRLAATPRQFSVFMQALLETGEANLSHAPEWIRASAIRHNDQARLKIVSQGESCAETLAYQEIGRIAVGVGCERDCPRTEIDDLIAVAESQIGVDLDGAMFASIDLKQNEAAFVDLAPDMRFFSATDLANQEVPNPSELVRAEVGTPSVAEASALMLAGPGSDLILPKIKNRKATLAIARAARPVPHVLPGKPRAHLSILGLGPGSVSLCTNQVLAALKNADAWVGYGLYLDQAEAFLGFAPTRHDYELGDEEARCRAALDIAAKGQRVALICSGDPQVYAMAQVVYELMARHLEKTLWQQAYVETLPGISAMNALAAKVGAPLGHDFCAISLSDLNTPWDAIKRKVQAAAEADFVIGFYNPRSKKRDWQLPQALEILRMYRPDDCPVVYGRNVARRDETIVRTTLAALNPEEIDMFTCLIVGASFTSRHKNFIFTPRGYKLDGGNSAE